MKKKEAVPADGESFLSRMVPTGAPGASSGSGLGILMPLAPPPDQPAATSLGTLAPPPAPAAAAAAAAAAPGSSPWPAAAQQQQAAGSDFFSLGGPSGFGAPGAPPAAAGYPAPANEDGWATFD